MGQSPEFSIWGIGKVMARRDDGVVETLTKAPAKLLGLMLAFGPSGATLDELADALYDDRPPKSWQSSTRMAVSRLRDKLPAEAIPDRDYRIALAPSMVDVWRVLELASDETSEVTEADLAWALAGEPYAGVDLPSSLIAAATEVKRAQRSLAVRFCASSPTTLSDTSCQRLESLVYGEPIDQDLVVEVVRGLAGAGRMPDAVELIRWFDAAFEAEMGRPPTATNGLLELIGSTSANAPPNHPRPHRHGPGPARFQLPRRLQAIDDECFGREHELGLIQGGKSCLITGVQGSGKTHVLAAAARAHIELGHEVSYVAADERQIGLRFEAFLTAFPALRDLDPRTIADEQGDDSAEKERSRLETIWASILDLLEGNTEHPHVLLVDDAQWLDESSMALLRLLSRSATKRPITLVVAGTSDDGHQQWQRLKAELTRAGLEEIELSGLQADSLLAMVRAVHDEATYEAQRGLSTAVLELTGGLPQPARLIIEAADPQTLEIPERIGADANLTWLIDQLDDDSRQVATVAAVLGSTFAIDATIALCDGDEALVERGIEELLRRRLIVETTAVHQLQFRHALIQQAVFWTTGAPSRYRLNLAAARLTDDVHDRARFLAKAGWAAPAGEIVDALRASASASADSSQWRQVIERLRAIEFIGPEWLSVDDLILFATALDLSGLDGTAPRRTAFDRAKALGDEPRALRAAVSALPNAERPDGEHARLDLLEAMDPLALTSCEQFEHAIHLARHRALTGNGPGAEEAAETALDLAATPADTGKANVAMWTAKHHLTARGHHIDETVLAAAPEQVRALLLQMRAISELEAGRLDEAEHHHREFRAQATRSGDPLRIWHALVFDALLEFEHGRLSAFEVASQAAFDFAVLHDLQEAMSVRVGQLFHLRYASDTHGELHQYYGLVSANIGRSSLAQASLALSQAAAGFEDDAIDQAQKLVGDALDRRRSLSIVVVALLSPLLAAGRRRDGDRAAALVERCRAFMLEFADRSVVVGFGIANMGPMWRYLAPLASCDDERREWLGRAVTAADRLGSISWRILTRMELAAELDGLPEAAVWSREARELTAKTDFVDHLRDVDV